MGDMWKNIYDIIKISQIITTFRKFPMENVNLFCVIPIYTNIIKRKSLLVCLFVCLNAKISGSTGRIYFIFVLYESWILQCYRLYNITLHIYSKYIKILSNLTCNLFCHVNNNRPLLSNGLQNLLF